MKKITKQEIKLYFVVAMKYKKTKDDTYAHIDAKKAMWAMMGGLEDKYTCEAVDFLDTLISEAYYNHKSVEQVIAAYQAIGYEVE